MQFGGKTIYVDPVGGGKLFAGLPKPDLVLVTHIHFDHFDPATLAAIVPAGSQPTIIAPADVAEKIPEALKSRTKVKILANGEKTEVEGIAIEAVPAYNITPGREKLPSQGPRQRLRAYVGRKEGLHCRRHRGHCRDACSEEHRHCLPADESAAIR